jgi:hypothetical protein
MTEIVKFHHDDNDMKLVIQAITQDFKGSTINVVAWPLLCPEAQLWVKDNINDRL